MNQPPNDRSPPASKITAISRLPREVYSAAARTRLARQQAQLPGSSLGDPADLVQRALAMLGSDSMKGGETTSVDLPLQRRVLNDGTECRLPIRYFDAQCLIATFLTDLERAAEILKGTGLRAVAQEDGKAVVGFGCFEYRNTDLGPYNEVGLTVLAVAPDDAGPGNYVANLPVTSALTSLAGREIWGYNKFATSIDIKRDRATFSASLLDPENDLIGELQGQRGTSVPMPPADLTTFSLLKGRLLKTRIQVMTPYNVSSGDGLALKVGPSLHPMADNLRRLALDGARPIMVQHADPFQALLFAGWPV